jgi:hypothetical protein
MKSIIFVSFLFILTFHIQADYVSSVTPEGDIKPVMLSESQEKLLNNLKLDIKYFHERLAGLMNYVKKNKKSTIKNEMFEKRDIAYIEHDTFEGRSAYVVNGDTFISFKGDTIESVKFSLRKGGINPRYQPDIYTREIENKFHGDDVRSIQLRVYHYPLAYGETNPIEVYDVDNVGDPNERLRLVTYYKENLRKLVRELENMVEYDQTRKNLGVWKTLKEVGAH